MLIGQNAAIGQKSKRNFSVSAPSQIKLWTLRPRGLASLFRHLAADMYALDLAIKATLQRDESLIKLSVPRREAAVTVLFGNLNRATSFFSSLPSVIVLLVMQHMIPVSSVVVSVVVQKTFNPPQLILSVLIATVHQNRKRSWLLLDGKT